MKRKLSRDHRLTDKGSIPNENTSFSIDVKGERKIEALKRRGMKTGVEKNRGSEANRHEDRGSQHENECFCFCV
jgi:hypothetical protein